MSICLNPHCTTPFCPGCNDDAPLAVRVETLAQALVESDAVGVFDDSNAGHAAALAAADLLDGWASYDAPYAQAHAHEYQPYDVEEVITQLRAWKAKGCPGT